MATIYDLYDRILLLKARTAAEIVRLHKSQGGHVPPESVRSAARRGLELRRKWKRGGLSNEQASDQGIGSGVQRATNLANGDAISDRVIGQMVGFFARHAKNYRPDAKEPDGGPTAGTIAWLLWGGNAGKAWAESVKSRLEKMGPTPSDVHVPAPQGEQKRKVSQRLKELQEKIDKAVSRHPAGSSKGGQFAPSGSAGGSGPGKQERADAADLWRGNGFADINGFLRGQKPAGTADEMDDRYGVPMGVKDAVKVLDQMIGESSLPSDMTVYRGVSGAAAQKMMDALAGKKTVRDPGFMAVSGDEKVASSLDIVGGGAAAVVRLKLPAGTKALRISEDDAADLGQDEWLLPRGGGLKITGFRRMTRRDGGALMELDAEYVPAKSDRKAIAKADDPRKTPAPPEDRVRGSDKNPKGSAADRSGGIELDEAAEAGLKRKVEEHNEAHGDDPAKRASLAALKAVWRRGAGAYSVSHRPGVSRSAWAMARVNAHLTLLRRGSPARPGYVQDNDLLPKEHPRRSGGKG